MALQNPGMLSQQDQEMRRNVPDPLYAGGSHYCGSGAGHETTEMDKLKTVDIASNGRFKYILIKLTSSTGESKTIVRGYSWAEYHG